MPPAAFAQYHFYLYVFVASKFVAPSVGLIGASATVNIIWMNKMYALQLCATHTHTRTRASCFSSPSVPTVYWLNRRITQIHTSIRCWNDDGCAMCVWQTMWIRTKELRLFFYWICSRLLWHRRTSNGIMTAWHGAIELDYCSNSSSANPSDSPTHSLIQFYWNCRAQKKRKKRHWHRHCHCIYMLPS